MVTGVFFFFLGYDIINSESHDICLLQVVESAKKKKKKKKQKDGDASE